MAEAVTDSTPILSHEQEDGRDDPRQRFALYRLCECKRCDGRGTLNYMRPGKPYHLNRERCETCRGEGKVRELVATCETPEALGVALVTLGREGEWDECPVGILDRMGEPGEKWIVKPWLPSARNVSDAGRTLSRARKNTPS